MEVTQLFHALGDPIRLEMVRRLASGQAHTLSSVSQNLSITRQGARKHVQVLADAGIVALTQKGRVTQVRLLRDTLDQGRAFIASLEKSWDTRLEKLKQVVEA